MFLHYKSILLRNLCLKYHQQNSQVKIWTNTTVHAWDRFRILVCPNEIWTFCIRILFICFVGSYTMWCLYVCIYFRTVVSRTWLNSSEKTHGLCMSVNVVDIKFPFLCWKRLEHSLTTPKVLDFMSTKVVNKRRNLFSTTKFIPPKYRHISLTQNSTTLTFPY